MDTSPKSGSRRTKGGFPSIMDGYSSRRWDGSSTDYALLKNGFVHLEALSAATHSEAIKDFSTDIRGGGGTIP